MNAIDNDAFNAENIQKQMKASSPTKNDFGEKLNKAGSTNTALRNAAVQAGTSVSAASVLSSVVRAQPLTQKAALKSSSSKLTAAAPGSNGLLTSTTSSGASSASSSASTATSTASGSSVADSTSDTSSSQLMAATQQMQEMNQTFNLQYLQLQEKMQAENRDFSAVSNVMKTKQDTAKNSLSNVK